MIYFKDKKKENTSLPLFISHILPLTTHFFCDNWNETLLLSLLTNSLLSDIDEHWEIVKGINAVVIGITDSKLDISINDSDFHRRLQWHVEKKNCEGVKRY